jgi:hypothetical protein
VGVVLAVVGDGARDDVGQPVGLQREATDDGDDDTTDHESGLPGEEPDERPEQDGVAHESERERHPPGCACGRETSP